MKVILLSGGSGKRLWPLSNGVRSKQFLKILRDDSGKPESMIQRMVRMIRIVDSDAVIVIAAPENQITSIRRQIGEDAVISVEPERRDTYPAIVLATAKMKELTAAGDEEAVLVCSVDPLAGLGFFRTLEQVYNEAQKNGGLTLLGIEPTYPSEKYGYIIPGTGNSISNTVVFKEKPDKNTAAEYIKGGALWNAGVFAYKIGYVLNRIEDACGFSDYQSIQNHYSSFPHISFDREVAEKAADVKAVHYKGSWKDLGTWNTFTEAMTDEVSGNAAAVDCENTHIVNELQIPLLAVGMKDAAVAATPDGILVTEKSQSEKIKDYIADSRPMAEKREWGSYQVLEYRSQGGGNSSLTKHLAIKQGQHLSYQCHQHRMEIWTVVEGRGMLVLDGEEREVARGDSAAITAGMLHGIKAIEELHIIEVQVGDELTEDDIERFEWEWQHAAR